MGSPPADLVSQIGRLHLSPRPVLIYHSLPSSDQKKQKTLLWRRCGLEESGAGQVQGSMNPAEGDGSKHEYYLTPGRVSLA